jgi:HEAT repeat protein
LIHLTKDSCEVVRDGATFGLGSLTDKDSAAICSALLARLDDPDDIVRGEALVGLARRQDDRVIKPLLRELEAGTYKNQPNDYAREALDALQSVERCPQLLMWKTTPATQAPAS